MMVILLLAILVPTWAVGHLIAGKYPVASLKKDSQASGVAETNQSGHDDDVAPDEDDGEEVHHDHDEHEDHGEHEGADHVHSDSPEAAANLPSSENQAQEMPASVGVESVGVASVGVEQKLYDEVAGERDELKSTLESLQDDQELAKEREKKLAQEKQQLTQQIRQLNQRVAEQAEAMQAKEMQVKQRQAKVESIVMPVAEPELDSPLDSKPDPKRSWTSTSGKAVVATLVGVEGETALLSARGRTFRVPIAKLIPADQTIIRQLFP